MKHYQLTVSGQVQGVGFRWGVYQYASQRPISGYVQNKVDGTVTVDCQADEQVIKALIAFIKHGPTPYARVLQLDQHELPIDPQLTDFSIR